MSTMLHLQFPRCCIFATLWHKYCHYVNKNWWQDFVIWCKDWYVYVWWLAVTNRCSVQICCMILCLSPRLKIWKVIKFIKNRVLGLFVCVLFFFHVGRWYGKLCVFSSEWSWPRLSEPSLACTRYVRPNLWLLFSSSWTKEIPEI